MTIVACNIQCYKLTTVFRLQDKLLEKLLRVTAPLKTDTFNGESCSRRCLT